MRILTVNVGSSSLKLALWEADREQPITEWKATSVGTPQATLAENGREFAREPCGDHAAAFEALLRRVPKDCGITAVGHRVVHGGAQYHDAVLLDDAVLAKLEALVPLSPLHQPPALGVIQACRAIFPELSQAAVFDTAFHAGLPPRAATYAVPATWRDAGVRRYGFHGIACADVVAQLGDALRPRAIILHLGAGCSATAVLNGRSIDTTMGFTPLEGLVMATRSGDLDPGALIYIQRACRLSLQQLDHCLNEESGLLGLSEYSADMRELLRRNDPRAVLAVEVFCYRAAKAVAGLTVALGGVDQIIFSGGIGEHAASVRRQIGALLDSFGVAIDYHSNDNGAPVVSRPDSAVEVRVISVDEGRRIARETAELLKH